MSVVYPSSCDASGKSIKVENTTSGENSYFTGHKVGIGTTNPAAPLSVKGGSPDTTNGIGQFLNDLTTSQGEDQNFLFVGKSTSYGEGARFGYRYAPTGNCEAAVMGVNGDTLDNSILVRKGGNVGIGWCWPQSKLAVTGGVTIGSDWGQYTAPEYGMIVEGNVGIGTTSPSYELDVAGTAQASTAVKTPAIRPVTDGEQAVQVQNANGSSTVLNVDTTNSRVGIGTTEPSSRLAVGGGATIGSDYGQYTAPSDGLLVKGCVGIGTTEPSHDLVVNGSAKFTAAIITPVIKPITDGFGEAGVRVKNAGGTSTFLYVETEYGKVGIGTTSPNLILAVSDRNSGLVTQAIFGQDKTSGQSQICIGEEAYDDKALSIGFDHGSVYGYLQIAGDPAGNGLVLANGGAVGIGTTNPGQKLDVNGNIKTSGQVLLGNVRFGAGSSLPSTSDADWQYKGSLFIRTSDGKLHINTADDEETINWTVVGTQS